MADGPTRGRNDDIAYTDILRTGPGTIAGRYLRLFWQPVYRSQDLPAGHAKPIRVMSEDFTIYRGATGAPHVVADRCVHRGVKLTLGTVEGDTIRCAYHGWRYGPDGACVEQPAEPRPFCDKVRIRAVPTKEYAGLIFAYLGEGEPPEFVRTPEFDDERYIRHVITSSWPCNYFAQMENTMDVTHSAYLHWQFQYHKPDAFAVERTPYGLKVWTPGLSGIEAGYDTHHLCMPNTEEFMAAPKPGDKLGFIARGWRVPKDDNSFTRFDFRVYRLAGKEADDFKARQAAQQKLRLSNAAVVAEAQAMVRGEKRLIDLKDQDEIVGTDMIQVQDCAVLCSLPTMEERNFEDMLGQTDLAVAQMRRMWTEELRALATGRPLTAWQRPTALWDDVKPVE